MVNHQLTPYFIVFSDWLQENTLQRVVMVISQVDTDEVVERWQFDIQCENTGKAVDQKGEKRFASVTIISLFKTESHFGKELYPHQ